MTNKTGCREAFEREWPNWDKYPSGNYIDDIVQASWEQFQSGWQAAWNAATQPPTDAQRQAAQMEFESAAAYNPHLFSYAARDTIKAALKSPAVPREVVDAFSELVELQDSALSVDLRSKHIVAPEDAEVKSLCERIGYGAVMDSTSRQWHIKNHGAGHTTYHCWSVVKQVTERAAKALALLGGKEG